MSAASEPLAANLDSPTGKRPKRTLQEAVVKIETLDEALEDLIQGFHFYEIREPGSDRIS